jgi:hypothetical protein
MTPNRPNQKAPEHPTSSQSAEDEPVQHGPLAGKTSDGTEHLSEGVSINRTSVGDQPNVPEQPITHKPKTPTS